MAIVRTDNSSQASRIVEACAQGGAAAVEITFTVPGATAVIEELAKRYPAQQIALGAGTVLDPETARIAILAGAQFIVSPSLNVGHRAPVQPVSDPVLAGRRYYSRDRGSHGIRRRYHQNLSGRDTRSGVRESRQGSAAASFAHAHRRRQHRQCRGVDQGRQRGAGRRRESHGRREDRRFQIHHRSGAPVYCRDSGSSRERG